MRLQLSRFLEAGGAVVEPATHNSHAMAHVLRQAQGHHPVDLLIQDHDRPEGGDGTQMVKGLRGLYGPRLAPRTGLRLRAVPIVVVSATDGTERWVGELFRRAPDATLLPKPVTERELQRVVSRVLADQRDRILEDLQRAGHTVHFREGWQVGGPTAVDTPLCSGTPARLAATLDRLQAMSARLSLAASAGRVERQAS